MRLVAWLVSLTVLLGFLLLGELAAAGAHDDAFCPTVKAIRHLRLHAMLGRWYIVQYYASSEEIPAYRCMRADLSLAQGLTPERAQEQEQEQELPQGPLVNMNFTYAFTDDPTAERLQGNITWVIPDLGSPAHWQHQEHPYQGVYNTYVLDTDYTSWALLLHCAEQAHSPRYLSSFILSREPVLPANVIAYLRDKLTRYAIDLKYMFPMSQENCSNLVDLSAPGPVNVHVKPGKRHPMQRHHKPKKHGWA